MNAHFIIGNLVRDPETGTTPAGVGWTRFVVAVRKRFPKEGEPDAEFMRVTAWRGLGENCAKYLAKGRKVCVIGPVSVRTYQASDGTTRASLEVTADDVEFLSSRADGEAMGGYAAPAAPAAEPQTAGFTAVETDDLPF